MEVVKKVIKIVLSSMVVNLLLVVLKYMVGVLGNLYVLIVDVLESFGDVFFFLFVVIGLCFVVKLFDDNYFYGYGKIELLIIFVVVGFLIFVGVLIIVESIDYI